LRKAEALAKNLGSKFVRCEFSSHLYDIYTKVNFFFVNRKAAPSKAFLDDQAEREPSERERAEKERAKRELARRQKHQSYEDFEPISISEFGLCFLFLYINYGH
jgi:hypothetical protein